MSGTISERVLCKWAYDFAGATPDFKDAYIGINDLSCFSTLTIGQQEEPIGFEFAYSSNAATFIERGLPHSRNPERNTGIRFQNTARDDSIYLRGGVCRLTDDQGNSAAQNEGWSASGRATWTPVFEDKGRKLVHVGVHASRREHEPMYAKASSPSNDGLAKYVAAIVDRNSGGRARWNGWYGFVSWFLTGEHRPYRQDPGAYSAVSPNSSFDKDGGGAWELAARFASLDLSDGSNTTTTGGGKLQDVTAGC